MSGERSREWVKKRFPNGSLGNLSYNTWTQEEDEKLLHALDTNMSISEISKVHERTLGAINSRVRRLAYLMYLNNESENEILRKTKITKRTLTNAIKHYGNKCKPKEPIINVDSLWGEDDEEYIQAMIDAVDCVSKNYIKASFPSTPMVDVEALAKKIYSQLGAGYSERVYHNAMEVLLRKYGVQYESERIVPVPFEGHIIGNLRADIIINNTVVLEFKTIKTLNEQAELQAQNYLRLMGLKIAYLINYPPHPNREVEVRCIVVEEQ